MDKLITEGSKQSQKQVCFQPPRCIHLGILQQQWEISQTLRENKG